MKQPTCDHVGFFTRNAKELAVFYTKILDFELIHDSMLSKSIVQTIFGLADDCRFVKLRKNDFIVEIFEPVSTELQKRVSGIVGINHWGYCANNRTAFVQKCRRDGLPVIEIDRNGRSAYFLIDPDGNRIEIGDCSK